MCFVREGRVRGCQVACLVGGPSQNWGMHPEPRRRSRHSRGEKYVLAGGAGQNMILSFSAGCGRRNSARRALPGESVERKGGWDPSGFLRAAARTCWVCPTGRVDGAEGGWIPYREAPTPKAFPSGGRCPSARTGADEGAIDSPNGAGEGGRKGDRSLLLQGKVGYRIAPSSVTFGDSFPPRGSLPRCYTPATKCFLTQTPLPQNANPNQGTYMGLVIAQRSPRCAPPRQNQRVGTSGP